MLFCSAPVLLCSSLLVRSSRYLGKFLWKGINIKKKQEERKIFFNDVKKKKTMKFKYSKVFFFKPLWRRDWGEVERKIFQYFSFHMIEEIEAKRNFNFITYY